MLTEGAVAHIVNNKENGVAIYGMYVVSPLLWGIHTGAKNSETVKCVDDLKDMTYAISRYGSGSHLMAFVDAKKRGWNTSALKFHVVGSLNGSRQALKDGSADIWMWEKFTTKWLVDSGEYLRVGVVETPWPCFCICVSPQTQKDPVKMAALEKVVQTVQERALQFKNGGEETIQYLMEKYKMLKDDAIEWLHDVSWSGCCREVDGNVLELVKSTLLDLNIISEDLANESIVAEGTTITSK